MQSLYNQFKNIHSSLLFYSREMATQLRPIFCIAAMDAKRGVGKDGKLAWHLPNEMKYFARITTDVEDKTKENAIIMGRKTWDSIPEKYRPLPNRLNIVLSRTLKDAPEKAEKVYSSLENALTALSQEPFINTIEKVFIIGGFTVYKDAIAHECCKKIYLTCIDHEYDCDVFFPEFDTNIYKLSSEEGVPTEVQEEKGVNYKFCIYKRE